MSGTSEEMDKVYFLADSIEGKPYKTTTWYRAVGVEKFVERVEEESKIVGVIFSGNNLGFILDEKKETD